MTCNCSISQAAAAMAATAVYIDPSTRLNGVSTDSRKLKQDELFVALTGENFDGHGFVSKAIAQGAVAAVVSKQWWEDWQKQQVDPIALPMLVVADTLKAYQDLARWWRQQTNLPVIAVTGSAGKTTTKELISALLGCCTQADKRVHKSTANHNNDIGVAQTLLAIDPQQHQFVVVEMGMRGKGEIARLAKVAYPTVSVITNIGTAHIGRLGSQEAIASAKCELLAEMSAEGIAVLNATDLLLLSTAKQVWHGQTLTYGLDVGDVKGELVSGKLQIDEKTWEMPLAGRHNAMNFLAGLAVLKALGLDWQPTMQGIGALDLPFGRAQIHHLTDDVIILDETYNASPEATIAALRLLADTPARRRWAILGAMKELGEMSEKLHRQVGEVVRNLNIDRLIVLSDGEADAIVTGADRQAGFVATCHSHAEITQMLLQEVKAGDRLLFKASRSVGMDRVVRDFQEAWQSQRV
ncbi:UDP-N-acetylmuramoyl-tripeptide--D-alanyl-D-alanine ligase [Tumidithrix elongata RA019]|uniref:UDP-N-acetylmuramoyl-tripeptide--D-alanyl-D-alanine ligase n=1 Tax=Tumidithrix elongata BACA0141 TaxID=2716417 RepID=A0AAW9Q1T6_9CYAN|nr:UDP-N-acetylmuramoyl-tripeptide--D-alanyl-D-alanine ligase [Tumidithrix elongata RA019]